MRAIVVIPALDEQDRIGACLSALSRQDVPLEVVLVDDGSRDDTVRRARRTAARHDLHLHVLTGPSLGPGPARQAGLDFSTARLRAEGLPHGLLATTDADTVVAPDWLRTQQAALDAGADAVGGWIELDPDEAARLPAAMLARRERRSLARLAAVRAVDPRAEHHHFGGASIGLRADVYAALGLRFPSDLEDAALAGALQAAGRTVVRTRSVTVVTSARTLGRARRGLAADLAGQEARR